MAGFNLGTSPEKIKILLKLQFFGIKYVYKGEPQNDDLTPPEEL